MPTARESLVAMLGPKAAEFQEGLSRGPGIALSQALPAWATQLIPWGEDAEGKQGPSLPGIVSGLYAGVGEYGPRAVNWIGNQLGYNTNLPQAPGAQAAQESFQNNARWATRVLPGVQPQNEAEQKLSDLAFSGAAVALPGGGLVKAVTQGAPAVVRGASHLLYPSLGAKGQGVMAGTVIGGTLGAYEDAQRDATIREMGLDPEQVKQYRTTGVQPVDLTQPDPTQTVAHPETGAPATVPFPTGSVTTPATPDTSKAAKYETLAEFGRPDIQIKTPNFNTTGETGVSLGNALGYGALAILGTAAALRYGGRVLDPAIKTITRQGDQINTVKRAQQFNANLDAIDQGKVLGPPAGKYSGAVRGEAPLPGKAGTVGTNLAQAGWDQTRVLTELSNATAPNSGVAKQMEARIGTINHSTPLHHMITEQMATGVNKANGGKTLPQWKAILQKYDNLTPEQQAKLDTGVYSGDEINTRTIKFEQAKKDGTPLNDEALRHNYRNVHSDELRQSYADMMADPATADVAKSIYRMQKQHMYHAFDMGRITQQAMNLIFKQRPHQIPSTNLAGEVEHALGLRDITQVGWDTPPTRAVDALTQHYAKLYEHLSENRLYDDLIKQGVTWQEANPARARIFNEILDPQGKPVPTAEGRTITVYREGVPHTYSIDNSNVHRAFKGNIVQTRMLMNTADSLRRSFQSGTTGIPAMAVAQRPFPIISLNRNIPQIAVDRTLGHFGVVDRLMQQATGGRIGYRGPEPSQWIGSYNEAVRGSAAVTARAISDALKRNGNPVTKALRATKGDVWVDAWSKKLEQRYLESNAAMRRGEGAAGAGGAGLYERPTYNISRGSGVGYSPMADVVPGVFHPEGIKLPYTRVHIPGTKGATSAYINMRTWLRDIHQEVMDGANSYYWKGMKNDPRITPEQRVFATRNVIGDPTMHGASVAAQRATHMVPWINPSVQDAVRMMRNLRDNPVAFTLGTTYTLGMMATASILSAMLGGSKHINRLARLMSTHDRASNMTLFHNPSDDNDYTQISLPQRWRMLYPILLEGVSEALGVFNLHQGEEAYNRIVHSLADLWNHHISHSTAVSAREGLEDFVGVAQPPPILQLGAALVGKKINEPISTVTQNVAEGNKLTGGIVTDADKAGKLPGQAAGSSYISNNDANWVHQVLSGIFGIAGDAMYTQFTNAIARGSSTHDIADMFSGMLTDAGQSWRDRAPFGNMIWGNNVKENARNPIAESNRTAWDKMTNMPKQADIGLTGLTRRGGVPIGVSGQPKVSQDPHIVQMLTAVNNYTSRMSKTIEPRINDLEKQLTDVDNDPHLDTQTKRRVHNNLVVKKNELEGQKSEEIERLNATLSWMAGGKHVDVRMFDPSQGMEQFHD